MPKSIQTRTGDNQTTTPKLPLFKGGQHGNALAQVIFTPEEWDLLKHALADYIEGIGGVDDKEAYQLLSERISDQETSEGNNKLALNLFCYDELDVNTLMLIAKAVLHCLRNGNFDLASQGNTIDSLHDKIATALDETTAYLFAKAFPHLKITFTHVKGEQLAITTQVNNLTPAFTHQYDENEPFIVGSLQLFQMVVNSVALEGLDNEE